MKEGATMSEKDSTTSPTLPGGDIPASWGFHLLQELRRIEDRLESKIGALETKMDMKLDATHSRIDALETTMDTKLDATHSRIDALETTMDTKLDATHSRIDALETTMDTKFDTFRREMDTKLDGLRYWSWVSIITVIAATITLIALHI